MSLDVLTAIWKAPPCKGGDLLCLLAIADNADEFGYAWPSVSTIARKAAMGERGAQKCIKKLSEAGLILVKSGGGRNKTNAYQITTNGIGEGLQHKNPEQNTPPPSSPFTGVNPERTDINPEPAFAKPRTPVHPNSHEPSIEPSVDTPIIPKPPPKKSKRAVSIPENWVPSDENYDHAISKTLTHEEIQNEADRFRDYHLAKGTRFKDWDAGWRTWVGNAVKYRNRSMAGKQAYGGFGQGGSIASTVARRHAGG